MGAQACGQSCPQSPTEYEETETETHGKVRGDKAAGPAASSTRRLTSEEKLEAAKKDGWSSSQAAAEVDVVSRGSPPEADLPSLLNTESGAASCCSSGRLQGTKGDGCSDEPSDAATVAVTPQWAASGRQLETVRMPAACRVGALCAEIAVGLGEEDAPLIQLVFAGQVLPPDAALADLASGENLVVDVIRLNPEFLIEVDRSDGGKLGVDVDFSDEVTLLIDAITPGLIQEWNDQNPTVTVKKLDRIVEVNGFRGDYSRLVKECRKDEVLTMVIRRSSPWRSPLRRPCSSSAETSAEPELTQPGAPAEE